MKTKDLVYLASKVFDKGWDFETFMYGDDAYNLSEEEIEDVWNMVDDIKENGFRAFREEYKDYKLY